MIEPLAAEASRHFAASFGAAPQLLVAAPGRVNFIGEHTDYNDGWVFPLAIDRHVLIAASPNGTMQARLRSALDPAAETVLDFSQAMTRGEPAWANYVRGVIAGFWQRGVGIPGFDAFIVADVPPGGGLSSSAALEVATATLVEALTGQALTPDRKALLCQKAEHDFAGVPCGVMDQFASVFGRKDHLLLLDCRSLEAALVPWPTPEMSLLVVNTGVKHSLADGEYAKRRRQCEIAATALGVKKLRDATLDDIVAARLETLLRKRARHIISENDRTLACAQALSTGDWTAVAQHLYASHASLAADFEVSCAELDVLVSLCRGIGPAGGVHGARMTGGGFGGSIIAVVETAALPAVEASLLAGYAEKTGRTAAAFATTPSDGAQIVAG